MSRYRGPTHAGDVWIHIDNIRRKDGRVWAVQWREGQAVRYECVKAVDLLMPALSVYDHKAKNPRAYLWAVNAQVEIVEGIAYVSRQQAATVAGGLLGDSGRGGVAAVPGGDGDSVHPALTGVDD